MTRDELLTLVREAGMWASSGEFLDSRQGRFLERFANLCEQRGAEKEREECAKVCEEHAPKGLQHGLSYAAAIRARKP